MNPNFRLICVALALTTLTAACVDDLDLGDFGPQSPGPMAENTSHVWLQGPVDGATSSDAAVMEIVIDEEGRAILHAGTAGTARVTVDLNGEMHDVDIEVRAVASRRIQPQPGGGFGLPYGGTAPGVTLLPGAALQARVLQMDAAGERLTGTHNVEWSTTGDGTLASQDNYVLLTVGTALGEFDLQAEGVDPMKLEVVSEDRVETLTVHSGDGVLNQPIVVEDGRSPTCHLAAWIDDGRYVQGAGEAALVIESSNPAVAVVIANNDVEPPPAGKQFTAHSRAFRVEAEAGQTATLTLRWSGQTRTVEVQSK
jgi:hypothetical protein